MLKMGYVIGEGLGKNSDGRAVPVPIEVLPQGKNTSNKSKVLLVCKWHTISDQRYSYKISLHFKSIKLMLLNNNSN